MKQLTIREYDRLIIWHCREMHEAIYKICCLSTIWQDKIGKWRDEALFHLRIMYKPELICSERRRRHFIRYNMFTIMVDEKNIEPDGDGLFRSAMNTELHILQKEPEDNLNWIEAVYIRNYVMPNITDVRERHKKRVGVLLRIIFQGIVDRDWNMILSAFDTYVGYYTVK